MPENEDDPKELRRRIDRLQSAFEKSEIERKADKKIQEAEMSALTSRLDKGFAENREAMARSEASNKEALAQNREAIARSEASNKEGLAQNREAITRNEAAIEKLRTDMYKAVVVIIGAIGAIIAFVEYGSR